MNDQRHLLKIKIKSLAAEAQIIRAAEHKRKVYRSLEGYALDLDKELMGQAMQVTGEQRVKLIAKATRVAKAKRRAALRAKPWFVEAQSQLTEMQLHRVRDVREEARAGYLAYGFIRGKTLREIGERAHGAPPWNALEVRVFEKAERLAQKYGTALLPKTAFMGWLQHGNLAIQWREGWPCLEQTKLPAINAPSDSGGTALAAPNTP
jgi:hypothetical protein